MQTKERIAQEGAREVVIIEDAASEGTINTVEDKHSENMEEFIDRQGVAGAIPEMFCTNKQNNFDEGSISRTVPEEGDCSREEDLDITPELGQCQISLQTYKEQTRYLQDINEKLMVANKRLQEDREEKEAEFQKNLMVSRNILKEKRAMQRQLEHFKAQEKENDKDMELARLQRHSQVLNDLATLAEASRSL